MLLKHKQTVFLATPSVEILIRMKEQLLKELDTNVMPGFRLSKTRTMMKESYERNATLQRLSSMVASQRTTAKVEVSLENSQLEETKSGGGEGSGCEGGGVVGGAGGSAGGGVAIGRRASGGSAGGQRASAAPVAQSAPRWWQRGGAPTGLPPRGPRRDLLRGRRARRRHARAAARGARPLRRSLLRGIGARLVEEYTQDMRGVRLHWLGMGGLQQGLRQRESTQRGFKRAPQALYTNAAK